MKTILKILLLPLLSMISYVSADNLTTKVSIYGATKQQKPLLLTVEDIEKNFKLTSKDVYNPWEEEKNLYEGILIKDFANHYAIKETENISFSAIDGYTVTLSKELWSSRKALLVTKMDKKYIPITKKGPLRIVFLDHDPTNKQDIINLNLWMWMITEIEFK